MSKLLVVVGATGSQGRGVISWFQHHEPTINLRGLTRTPSSSSAQALAKTGVEIVKADLNDLSSLKSAFQGASYIFAYTDFLSIVQSPQIMGRFQSGDIKAPIGAAAFDIEVQQGKNVADAAASVSQLERLVWSTLPHVHKLSGGKYTQVFHFDSKAVALDYMLQSPALQGKVSSVLMGGFLENFVKMDMFKLRLIDGIAVSRNRFQLSDAFPFVDVEKDTGAFVKALIDAPAPMHVLGTSETLTVAEFLALWSEETGMPSRHEQSPEEEMTKDDVTGLGLEFLETFKFVDEFGYNGGETVLLPEDVSCPNVPRIPVSDKLTRDSKFEKKTGVSILRTKVVDFIKRNDWAKHLSA